MRRCRNAGARSAAHPLGRGQRGLVGGRGIGAVGLEPAQVGAFGVGGPDPAWRGAHADPEAVVLADEQERERQVLVGDAGGGVDGPGRRRVVGRRVAEAADGQRVGRPRGGHAEAVGAVDAEGDAEGARQVGGDGRGLGDDRQVVVAEDLVASAGHRLVRGRHEAEQDVSPGVVSRDLHGPAHVEAAGAVVEQGRVGRAQRRGDRRVGLVAGRADRVVAEAAAPQPAGGQVEVAAGGLGLEERHGVGARQRAAGADRERRVPRGRGREGGQRVEQVAIDR